MIIITKIESIEELNKMDHSFLTPNGVKRIVEPFGFDYKEFIGKYKDRRSEFKGLYVPSVKEGDWVEGADASTLSIQICNKLGVKYMEMFGRGSQLHVCCDALLNHLQK